MRILIASDQWFPDRRGGVARVATETALGLAERGHDIDVLVPTGAGRPRCEQKDSLTVRRTLRRSPLPQTVTDPWETRRAARRLGGEPDVAIAHTSTTAAGLAAARLRAPLVLVYHASAPREIRFERSRLALGQRRAATHALEPVLALLERTAVAHAQRIFVLSEFSRTLLDADHPEAAARALLVRAGVDTAAFSPGDRVLARQRLGVPEETRLLVTVRRLEPRMGLESLLEAVAVLGAGGTPLELAIVGDGSLRRALERRKDELGLRDAVRLLGHVPDSSLVDWYRAADVFVLPTLAYEGFGIVTAEALACGTPVIGTPVGATPELLRPLDERLLARGVGSADLADAISRGLAIVSPDLRKRCRAYAETQLSWSRAVETWEDALVDVVRDRPLRRRKEIVRPRVALVGPDPAARGGVAGTIHALAGSRLGGSFELTVVPTHCDGSRAAKLRRSARGLSQLARLSLRGDVDLVHVHSSWGASFPRKALAVGIARAGGRRVVLQVHGSSFRTAIRRSGLRGAAARRCFGLVARGADAVVAATPAWADELERTLGLEHVHVVPNAADVTSLIAVPREAPQHQTVLFLGRLERAKGVFELVDAIAKLRRERPGLRLVLAGRGRDELALTELVSERGLVDAVELTGWVDGEDKRRLLAGATCLALPSYAEGLPLAVLEAMLSGVPVVATRVGGIPEAARDGDEALLVTPGDVAELAEALGRVLDDERLAARLARAARKRALEKYHPDQVAGAIGAVYADVLGLQRASEPAERIAAS